MPSFLEKLQGVYGNDEIINPLNQSWIPKRKSLLDTVPKAEDISELRAQAVLDKECLLNQCREDIFTAVATFLFDEYGEDGYETRQTHFQESWEKMYSKYGNDLVFALAEITDGIHDEPFVNFSGYLNKGMVKSQVESIRKRAKKSPTS